MEAFVLKQDWNWPGVSVQCERHLVVGQWWTSLFSVGRWRADRCSEKRPVHSGPGVQRPDLTTETWRRFSGVQSGPSHASGCFIERGFRTEPRLSAMQKHFRMSLFLNVLSTLFFITSREHAVVSGDIFTSFLSLTWAQHEVHVKCFQSGGDVGNDSENRQKLLCGLGFYWTLRNSWSETTWRIRICSYLQSDSEPADLGSARDPENRKTSWSVSSV